MDSMQPVLPAERIRIYGLDGNRHGKAKTKNQRLETNIKIIEEIVTQRSEYKEIGVRRLQGAYPQMGEIIQGANGYETLQKFIRFLEIDMQN